MKPTQILLNLATLLSSSLALPTTSNTFRFPVPTAWFVYNYTEGCSPAACVYGFNIAWGSGTPEPGFSTYCTGNNIANKWQACEDPVISSNEIPGTGNFTAVVQHTYMSNDGAEHYVKGNATTELGTDSFAIYQREVRAAA